jgi:uncharacterized OsmC-like protein
MPTSSFTGLSFAAHSTPGRRGLPGDRGALDWAGRAAHHARMADEKVEIIASSSSGTIGRARNEVRGVALALDSSSRPQPDAFTNSEAFLGAVSSCGVTLIEMHAKETGVPLSRMTVTIEGRRPPTLPRFSSVTMTFEMTGVSQAQAEALVETYRSR